MRVLVLSLALLVACSPVEPPPPAEAPPSLGWRVAPVSGGQLDTAKAWPGVGIVLLKRGGYCSGTLIHADAEAGTGLVLTAAHCVLDVSDDFGFNGLEPHSFELGPDLEVTLAVGRAFVHPRFGWDRSPSAHDPWPIFSANDLAVFEVTGVDATIAAWVVPIWDEDAAPVDVGDPVTVVGLGQPQSQKRQVGAAVVHRVDVTPLIEARYRQIAAADGAVTCPGDSGGPLVVDGEGGRRVIGVHSSGTGGGCGAETRVSTSADALEVRALVRALLDTGEPLPFETCWACAATSGTCEATSAALAAIGPVPFELCVNEVGPGKDLAGCSELYPEVRAALDLHWDCLERECAGLCEEVDRLFMTCEYVHDAGGPCDACILSECCAEASECMNDSGCYACSSTVEPDLECQLDAGLVGLYACTKRSCREACGPYLEGVWAIVTPDPAEPAPEPAPEVTPAEPPPEPGPEAMTEPAPEAIDDAATSGSDEGCAGGPPPWHGLALLALGLMARARRARV